MDLEVARAGGGRHVLVQHEEVDVALGNDGVTPIATSGASILSSTVRADGAVIVPRQLEGMAAGSEVEVLLYDEERRP